MTDKAATSAPKAIVAQAAALRAARKVTSAPFENSSTALVTSTKKRKHEDVDPGASDGGSGSGSEIDSSDEEREQRSLVTSATVKKIYIKLEELEQTIENELKPLAYATLERMEKLEALLVKGEQSGTETPDYLESPGQREREVVTGMGWGDQADRKQKRIRRVSREVF